MAVTKRKRGDYTNTLRVRCDECGKMFASFKNAAKHCRRYHAHVPQWLTQAEQDEACMNEENKQMLSARNKFAAVAKAFIRRENQEHRQRLATFLQHQPLYADVEALHQQYIEALHAA
jgi:hypothetical protein